MPKNALDDAARRNPATPRTRGTRCARNPRGAGYRPVHQRRARPRTAACYSPEPVLSIGEVIARMAAEGPPQLYRGGA